MEIVPLSAIGISKGFLQSEVLDEVSVLEGGGSSGRSFSRSLRRSFPRSFRACFAGTFRAKKTSAKTSAPNSHESAQQNWRNFRETLHDEVLQGDHRQDWNPILLSFRASLSNCSKHLSHTWWQSPKLSLALPLGGPRSNLGLREGERSLSKEGCAFKLESSVGKVLVRRCQSSVGALLAKLGW